MAAMAGRKMRIKYDSGSGGVVIAGARTDSITINNTPIDITDKGDAGVQTLLDDIGTKNFEMSCEGVLIDDVLADLARDATESAALHDMEFDIGSVGTYSGSFFISSFEQSGAEGDEAATFTASFTSAGAVTYA